MPERITVLHLRISNFIGGPEKQILEHMVRLNKEKFRPLLCCFRDNGIDDPLQKEAEALGIPCRIINTNSAFDLKTISQLVRILREEKVNLICSHGYKPNMIGRLASWQCGVAAVAVSRGWTAESTRIRLYEKLDKIFLRLSDHVVAVSHGQREKILALGVKREKVSVIHNAINLDEIPAAGPRLLREQLGLPADAMIVASAGRLSPEKNYGAMVQAAAEVVTHNQQAYFVIFGEGFLRLELEQAIAAAGLTGRFLLPGFRTDLQAVLHEIDIFMLPSFTEGLPNVVLEAFAVGKPVVATRVGGTPEVVQDGVSGFLTAPDQANLMAQHLLQLLNNPSLRQTMGNAGHKHVREHFSFESQTEEYEALYRRVASKSD